jgi:hypothetical protein
MWRFADFKGVWWVKDNPSPVGEAPGHRVVIGGVPSRVTILCIDSQQHPFNIGTYEPLPEGLGRIRFQGDSSDYEISLTPPAQGEGSEITCRPISDSNGPGSWTAEDNPSGDGPGGH